MAFAPGFEPGTDETALPGDAPTVEWDALTVGGSGGALAATLGSASNPTATATITARRIVRVTVAFTSRSTRKVTRTRTTSAMSVTLSANHAGVAATTTAGG